jgi:hypothetical protein
MKLPHRRQFLHLAAGAAALPAASRIARAQAYPTRPVRVIVPFAPAGSTDIAARLMGQWLSERLGQQFVIENRPGASTTIGTEAVVRAPADGYTLLLVGTASAINTTLFESKLNYNFLRDIVPIAGIFRVPNVMVVRSVSAGRTIGRAVVTRARSCAWTLASSCDASCSTCCRTVSIAFATTGSSPTPIAPTSWRSLEAYSMCPLPRRIAMTMMTVAQAVPTTSCLRVLVAEAA